MKLKFIFLPVLLCLIIGQVFSSQYVLLDQSELAVRSGPQGSPVVELDGVSYFVRDWQPEAGCYRLVSVEWIGYHLARRVSPERCSGENQSG